MDSTQPDAAEGSSATSSRVIDLFVYAPIGALARACEQAPGLVALGRDRVRSARALAELVVEAGEVALRQTLRRAVPDAAGDATTTRPDSSAAAPPATRDADVVTAPRRVGSRSPRGAGAGAARLPIDNYDSLAASQIVDLLASLSSDELTAVADYERSHRNRRTVLGRVAQLSS